MDWRLKNEEEKEAQERAGVSWKISRYVRRRKRVTICIRKGRKDTIPPWTLLWRYRWNCFGK